MSHPYPIASVKIEEIMTSEAYLNGVESFALPYPQGGTALNYYDSFVRVTQTAEQLYAGGFNATYVIEGNITNILGVGGRHGEQVQVAQLGGYVPNVQFTGVDSTFLTTGNVNLLSVENSDGGSIYSDGYVGRIDVAGNVNLTSYIARGDFGEYTVTDTIGSFHVGSFVGGDWSMSDSSAVVDINNADWSTMSFCDFSGSAYTEGNGVSLAVVEASTWIVEHRGDESTVELSNVTTQIARALGVDNSVLIDHSSIQQLTVGAEGYVNINQSQIFDARFGQDTDVQVHGSQAIIHMEGGNLGITSSEVLVFAANNKQETITVGEGARVDVVADPDDLINFGATTWEASILERFGQIQLGDAVVNIRVSSSAQEDFDIGRKGRVADQSDESSVLTSSTVELVGSSDLIDYQLVA